MEQDEMIKIPYVVHEGDMAREERKQKRLWILLLAETVIIGVFICQKFITALRTNR